MRVDTVNFRSWCAVRVPVAVGSHQAGVIESFDDTIGVAALATALPGAYAESRSLALIARRLGKDGVAKFLSNKLPTKPAARSGDVGEVFATAYLHDELGWVVGPSRLIQRDHQQWAMRGDDVLGAKLDAAGRALIIKGEAKSRVTLAKGTVTEARKSLAREKEMPSAHSLTQFAERLLPTADAEVGEAVLMLMLLDEVRAGRVSHLMFLFTSNDPSQHVTADLLAYTGAVPQLTITLRVQGHKKFIADAFDLVVTDGA